MTFLFIGVYLLILIVFVIGSVLALYQIRQFGYVGDASARVITGYIIISAAVIILTFLGFILAR